MIQHMSWTDLNSMSSTEARKQSVYQFVKCMDDLPVAGHRTLHVNEGIHLRAQHDGSRRWPQYSGRWSPSADL